MGGWMPRYARMANVIVIIRPIAMVVTDAMPTVNQINKPAPNTIGNMSAHNPTAPPNAGAPPAPPKKRYMLKANQIPDFSNL